MESCLIFWCIEYPIVFTGSCVNSPTARRPWPQELGTGQGTEEELRKAPGQGQRAEDTQVPMLRSSATAQAEAVCHGAVLTGHQGRGPPRGRHTDGPTSSPG